MADSAPGGTDAQVTFSVDRGGWFKTVSPAFLALIGREVASLAGTTIVDLVHPGDAPGARTLLTSTSPGTSPVPLRLFDADESWRPLLARLASTEGDRLLFVLSPEADPFLPATPARAPALSQEGSSSSAPAWFASTGDFAGDDTPMRRAEVRDHVGDATTPMIEIDPAGNTVFVRGGWPGQPLDEGEDGDSGGGADGAARFEQMLTSTSAADEVGAAIDAALRFGTSSTVLLNITDVGRRWAHVVPIPSPVWAGVAHALIAVRDIESLPPLDSTATPSAHSAAHEASAPAPERPAVTPAVQQVTDAAVPGDASVPERAVEAVALDEAGALERPAVTPADVHEANQPEALAAGDSEERPAVTPAVARDADELVPHDGAVHAEETVDSLGSDNESHLTDTAAPDGGRSKIWAGVGAVATYVALQGFYLGPVYGVPSPLNGLLDANRCDGPSCGPGEPNLNLVAILALLVAIGAAVAFFADRRHAVAAERPHEPQPLGPARWALSGSGPGLFGWLSVAAVAFMIVQAVAGNNASVYAWLLALGCGAVATWRADRDDDRDNGSTMAAVAIALACLLVTLGVGTVWLGERRVVGVVLVVAGLMLVWRSLWLQKRSQSSFDRWDYLAMVGLAVLALVLGLARHRSWRYALVGEEWAFFTGARNQLRGASTQHTFEVSGSSEAFTGLTYEMQAFVMGLAGDNVWGWRLSSLIPFALSVAATYAVTRWLAGRAAAVVAASALATGHMLLSFSMAPFSAGQSLAVVSVSLAALAWAHQRPSALRFFLFGAAAGSTFLVFPLARLALLPLAVLFFALFRRNLASLIHRIGWTVLGALAMAAPALFSTENWSAAFTEVQRPAPTSGIETGGVGRRILNGWLSFIADTSDTAYVVGPHLDVISAALLIVGLGYAIARARTDITLRWFVVGAIIFWTAISAVHSFAIVSNTRMFLAPLIYCVFVGLGVTAVLSLLQKSKTSNSMLLGSGACLVLLLLVVNQWHISAHADDRMPVTEQALLVQQFQQTESTDGHGMPVHVAWPEERNELLTTVLRAHEIAAERIVITPGSGAVNEATLCAESEPIMAVLHRDFPEANEVAEGLAACWGTQIVELEDGSGAPQLLRVSNAAGQADFDKAQADRYFSGPSDSNMRLTDAVDVAVDGQGVAYAMTRTLDGAHIHRIDGGGSFALNQRMPIDFDITADGLFVVAGTGGDDRLVWYDGRGNLVNRYPGQSEMPAIGGITVAGDQLWVSDIERARLLSFDPAFELTEIRTGQSLVAAPSALAAGPDGSVWVFDARLGEIMLVTADDQVPTRLAGQVDAPLDVPRLSSTDQGYLVRAIPDHPVVELVAPDGRVIDAQGGVPVPVAAAMRDGELVVADVGSHEITTVRFDPWQQPADRGVVSWDTRSLQANAAAIYESAFDRADAAEVNTIDDIAETELVPVNDRQAWRPVGIPAFAEAHAIAATADGAVVVDTLGRLVRLDAEGQATSGVSVGGFGTTFVSDVVVDDTGTAWVLDAGSGRITHLSADDDARLIDTDNGPLRNARGIGLGKNNSVWIAATAAAQIREIADTGAVLRIIELPGRQPSDVIELADGTIWIVDAQDLVLVQLRADGTEAATLPLSPFTSIESPHLAVIDDVMWVTDPDLSRVIAINPVTAEFTGDQIALARPDGSAVVRPIGIGARNGQLWMVDSLGAAVVLATP